MNDLEIKALERGWGEDSTYFRVECCPSSYNRRVALIVDMGDYYAVIGEDNLPIAKVFKGNDITVYYK